MKIRAMVYTDDGSGRTVNKRKVLTVVRVRVCVARVLGSNFSVKQHILVMTDRYGTVYEYDLSRPLEIKNKKGNWIKRFGK